MPKSIRINMEGKKFGRLVVLEYSHTGRNKDTLAYWKCKCDCGNTIITSGNALRKGNTKSCGCLQKEKASKAHKIHGMSNSLLYKIWQTMIQRCENPNREKFKRYGGRGIRVCKAWHKPSIFIKWALKHGYKEHLTIDRKDTDKGYFPKNCQWLTNSQNSRKRKQ